MPRARTDQMSGTEITRTAITSINEVDWIIELKKILKIKKMIKYEGDIWTLFWGNLLFSSRITTSLCLANSDEFLNGAVVCSVSGTRGRTDPAADKNKTHFLFFSFFWISSSLFVFGLILLSGSCFVLCLFLTPFWLLWSASDLVLFYTFPCFLPLSSLDFNWGTSFSLLRVAASALQFPDWARVDPEHWFELLKQERCSYTAHDRTG